MGVKELIDKLKGFGKEEEEEPYEAKEVIDRPLDSLRRERQFQMNQEEKIRLKRRIAEYKKDQTKRHMYGIDDKREKIKSYLGEEHKKKKVCVMNEKQQMMKHKSIMEQKNRLRQRSILQQKNKLRQKSILRSSALDNRKDEFKKKKQKNYFI